MKKTKIKKHAANDFLTAVFNDLLKGNEKGYYQRLSSYFENRSIPDFSAKHNISESTIRRAIRGSNHRASTFFKLSQAIASDLRS